jgi:plastocyanin
MALMHMRYGIWLPGLVLGVVVGLASCGGGDGGVTEAETGDVQVAVTTDGSAASGVPLALYVAGGASPAASATTGTSGTATFSRLEPGSYEVEVDPPSGIVLSEGEQARKPVTVTSGQTSQVDFALTEEDLGNVVEITLTSSFTFSPATVTISPGTTVRWVNGASIYHTITPDGHSEWDRATMDQAGETFQHTFDNTGSFPYYCEPHRSAGMTGTITVQ